MADVAWTDSDVYFRDSDVVWTNHLPVYADIPPSMHQDLIDPYSGGAWLWLCQIIVPGYATIRIARNTEDIVYGEKSYDKFNLQIGEQMFSGDGSIPRVTLRVFQDVNRIIEDMVNETEGAIGANVKLIRVCEKYLDTPVAALEADYENLAAESDSEWVTFTIGVPNPLTQRFPLRIDSYSSCPWATPSLFKGPECQYTGSDGTCTGTYNDCWTKGNAVHWGAELGLDPNVVKV
jgi:phage-related protein